MPPKTDLNDLNLLQLYEAQRKEDQLMVNAGWSMLKALTK